MGNVVGQLQLFIGNHLGWFRVRTINTDQCAQLEVCNIIVASINRHGRLCMDQALFKKIHDRICMFVVKIKLTGEVSTLLVSVYQLIRLQCIHRSTLYFRTLTSKPKLNSRKVPHWIITHVAIANIYDR